MKSLKLVSMSRMFMQENKISPCFVKPERIQHKLLLLLQGMKKKTTTFIHNTNLVPLFYPQSTKFDYFSISVNDPLIQMHYYALCSFILTSHKNSTNYYD